MPEGERLKREGCNCQYFVLTIMLRVLTKCNTVLYTMTLNIPKGIFNNVIRIAARQP